MYFGICNTSTIRNLKLNGKKMILIQCLNESEYLSSDLVIENIDEYSNVLRLNVEDSLYFDLENAKLLNEFIVNNDFDEVITCCGLGISRSPAIMICVSRILEVPIMEKLVIENYKYYNEYIVDAFERFPYETKECNDSIFVLREKHRGKDDKSLIKRFIID